MTIKIKKFDSRRDLGIINNWLKKWGEPLVTSDFFTSTSYVAFADNNPVATASLYLTNCKNAAIVEMVVGNPDNPRERKECLPRLFNYLEILAKMLGYKYLVILALEEKIKLKYENLGFLRTKNDLSSFVKTL